MHLFKQAGYFFRIILLWSLGLSLAIGGLAGLGGNPDVSKHTNLLIMFFGGLGLCIAAAYRTTHFWKRTKSGPENEATHDQLIWLAERLLARGITRASMTNDDRKEVVQLRRDSNLLDTEYEVTVTVTEQLMPQADNYQNSEMCETQQFGFSKQKAQVDRTITLVYKPHPNATKELPSEELSLDKKHRMEGRLRFEEQFTHANDAEIDELASFLRRAAQSNGIVLDG